VPQPSFKRLQSLTLPLAELPSLTEFSRML
jgi:hypothetical protein